MTITPFLIDLLMVYLLVRFGAQHDAFSDRAKVDGADFPEVSDRNWHFANWKWRWPALAYFAVESYFDLLAALKSQDRLLLAIFAPLVVLIMASAHDLFYFKYRRELAKYADGRKRPEWIDQLSKFLRDVWGLK